MWLNISSPDLTPSSVLYATLFQQENLSNLYCLTQVKDKMMSSSLTPFPDKRNTNQVSKPLGSLSSLDEVTTCVISFAFTFLALSGLFLYCCKVLIWDMWGTWTMPGVKSVFLVVGSWLGWENIALKALTFFLPSTSFEDGLQTLEKA